MDEPDLELIERRLSDRIVERVRPALFRQYAMIGLAIGTVLGYAGWDFVANTKREVKDYGRAAVDQQVEFMKKTVEQHIDSMKKDMDALHKQLGAYTGKIDGQLQFMDRMGQRADNASTEIENKLRGFNPKVRQLDETAARVDDLLTQVAAVEQQRKQLGDKIADMEDTRRRVEADLQRLPSAAQVTEITSQLHELSKGVARLAERAGATEVAATATTVVAGSEQTRGTVLAAQTQPTVWFQFAGGASRDSARVFAKELQSAGYVVPEPDRQASAARKREVRYYHEGDRSAAERLAADAAAALTRSGFPAQTITTQSMLDYPRKKPVPGMLELWLELPPQAGGG